VLSAESNFGQDEPQKGLGIGAEIRVEFQVALDRDAVTAQPAFGLVRTQA
jgi:hypothetical protein